MKKFFEPLKRAWEENPLQVIVIGTGALMGGAMMLNAVSKASQVRTERKNSTTWQKEVDRRYMMAR